MCVCLFVFCRRRRRRRRTCCGGSCLSSWLCFVVVVFVAVFAVVVKVTDAPLVPGTREGHASFLDTLPLLGLGNHARRSGYKTTAYCNRRSLFIFSFIHVSLLILDSIQLFGYTHCNDSILVVIITILVNVFLKPVYCYSQRE